MSQTRDSVALGMREAEVLRLRIVIDDLRDIVDKSERLNRKYESFLRQIVKHSNDNNARKLAERALDEG